MGRKKTIIKTWESMLSLYLAEALARAQLARQERQTAPTIEPRQGGLLDGLPAKSAGLAQDQQDGIN